MKWLPLSVTGLVLCALLCIALVPPAAHATAAPEQSAPHTDTAAEASAKAIASTPHGAIPFKQEKQSTDTLAYQSFAALILVGLAAYGIVFGLKRFGGAAGVLPGKVRRVRTLEAIRLGKHSTLHVVEYQGRELLLAESEHGVQLLTSGPPAPPAPKHAAEQGATDA